MTRLVQVGDRVRDNRRPERVLLVTGLGERVDRKPMPGSILHATRPVAWTRTEARGPLGPDIRLDRIHTDGKPRRSGWSLVREEEAE